MNAVVYLHSKNIQLYSLIFIFVAAQASNAAPGNCTLQVDGHTYLSGICNVEVTPGGSFTIGMGEERSSKYFASVEVNKSTGTAKGFWNGTSAESHAGDDLGTLTHQGACWVNSHARVCAATNQNRKTAGLDDFTCPQMISLYALTSKAQLQCGYRYYNPAWVARSRTCSASVGSPQTDMSLRGGTKMFDDDVASKGLPGACSSVLDAFPDALRR